MQTGAAPVESSMEIPQKIKNEIASCPSNSISGNISKETENANLKEHTHFLLIAVLFTITKMWKQPKCPSVDEWLKQLWDIYTMEYHSAMKKKKILPFASVWMYLENIMLSDINQSEKTNTI